MLCSTTSFADRTVKKNLGDINSDGVKEIAVEDWSIGSSGESAMIKIFSGKKQVLGPIGLSGDTADGYKIIGKQVIVWTGDWQTSQSKWEPHYYDIRWYSWDKKAKKFVIIREAFTKNSYDHKQAEKILPRIAVNQGPGLVLSHKATFAKEAVCIANQKYDYHKLLDVADEYEGNGENKCSEYGHMFRVVLGWKKDGTSSLCYVMFTRSGQQLFKRWP